MSLGKIRRQEYPHLQSISGGQSSKSIVTDFVACIGGDPDYYQADANLISWQIMYCEEVILRVELEQAPTINDEVITLSVPLFQISIKNVSQIVISVLELSKGLVGCRMYLQGAEIILAASLSGVSITKANLKNHLELILSQRPVILSQFS